jgi:AraC-like DNA-binding protein
MLSGKWFLKKRLQFATDLLLKEGKRPSEIYEELGFESLSSFTQAFKTEYKVTPRQFKA